MFMSGKVNFRKFKYFIFVNSSVRGPYMPAYAARTITWTQAFVRLLSDDVKLVGPSVNCEATWWHGDVHQKARHNAHVQSYAMATDRWVGQPQHIITAATCCCYRCRYCCHRPFRCRCQPPYIMLFAS